MFASNETASRLEPCLLEAPSARLIDLLTELVTGTSQLGGKLHPLTAAHLADLVRMMNCYYSNSIEGHNTRPRDIERALGNDLDIDEKRRNLQLEARAHIRLQEAIDREFAAGTLPDATRVDFIRRLHREFYVDAPTAMLTIGDADRSFFMSPGEMRNQPSHEVVVGRHLPPSSAVVGSFMTYFEARYNGTKLGPAQRVLAIPAAHHRLNYIHPFPDGNGRVSRLMSHAMAQHAGIGAHGLWSISRGLARGLQSRSEYKQMMDLADTPRQSDVDGRGNLSERALTEFSIWFFEVCLDQVRFMSGLFDLEGFAQRLRRYATLLDFRPEAGRLLVEILHRGEIARGDAAGITALGERTARALLSTLLRDGIVGSTSEKGPVSLRFPMRAEDVLFPRLFPES